MDMRYDRLVLVLSLSTAFGMMLAINTLLFVFSLSAQISLGAVGFRLGWIAQVTGVVSIVILSEAIMTWLVGVVFKATWFRGLVVATIHLTINLVDRFDDCRNDRIRDVLRVDSGQENGLPGRSAARMKKPLRVLSRRGSSI